MYCDCNSTIPLPGRLRFCSRGFRRKFSRTRFTLFATNDQAKDCAALILILQKCQVFQEVPSAVPDSLHVVDAAPLECRGALCATCRSFQRAWIVVLLSVRAISLPAIRHGVDLDIPYIRSALHGSVPR